jgi:transposase-like protein
MTTTVQGKSGSVYVEDEEAIERLYQSPIKCKYCGSADVVNNGYHKNRQGYLCHKCGRAFIPHETGKILKLKSAKPTKEELEKWYIEDELSLSKISVMIGHNRKSIRGYLQFYGIKIRTLKEANKLNRCTRDRSYLWKGGRTNSDGYILIRDRTHPHARKDGYVSEHILVWERVNNKRLPDDWIIHHLNGIKDDNRPENLLAMPSKEHMRILPAKARRIRELEEKVKMLEKVLSDSHIIIMSN